MARWSQLLLSTIVAAALATGPALAEETTTEPSVAELIAQLEAESYAERQAASDKLLARGKDVLPELSKAAQSDSAEVGSRAFEILRKHFESSDVELQAAARETLQKLAKGEHAAARRAEEIIQSKKTMTPPAATRLPIGLPGPAHVPLGALRVKAIEIGPGVRRISVKSVNGVKEIQVHEEGRQVDISDDPEKGIKVKVTEKKDGKDETKEYEAKDADELKSKHPAAHKLYEQYGQKMAAIRVDAIGGAVRGLAPAVPGFAPAVPVPGFVPAVPGIAPALPVVRRKAAIVRDVTAMVEQLEKSQKQLEEATEQLKKLAGAESPEEVKKALEAIEASRKALDEVRAQIPDVR